jgi:hypothetical protein
MAVDADVDTRFPLLKRLEALDRARATRQREPGAA